MTSKHLLIIDPQWDFCHPEGALFVQGANKDMSRLAQFINKNTHELEDITVTLDTHRYLDIAHPIYWINQDGEHPEPFTIITKEDVVSEKWVSTFPAYQAWSLEYVTRLEETGKKKLCIWPPHCLFGSLGNSIYPELFASLINWEKETGSTIGIFLKGLNIWTEHYSIFKPEVIDEKKNFDPTIQFNQMLLEHLVDSSKLLIAGEASSHCVAESVKDLIENSTPDFHKRIVLLKDAMSPVKGFEQLEESFFNEVRDKGVEFYTTSLFEF